MEAIQIKNGEYMAYKLSPKYDDTPNFSVSNNSFNGHEYVDLGLPSGTLWATCNIGASKPEDYGNYYAWGETESQTFGIYNWASYKYANDDKYKLTKYCNKSDYGDNSFTDSLTVLQSDDDPATVNWGSGWCVPTKEEFQELCQNTTLMWTTQNGVEGGLFTSKNGQTLFLPAAGSCWTFKLYFPGSDGCYWSRSLDTGGPDCAWSLSFNEFYSIMSHSSREGGYSVRPVRKN